MNGLESDDDDDDDDESDGEMGMDDTEDGEEAESMKLKKLAAQVRQVIVTTSFLPSMIFLLELTFCQFVCSFHRQRPSAMMMKMMTILMMTLAMTTSFNHPSMRWMRLYSLSMQSEVNPLLHHFSTTRKGLL